MSFRRFAGYFMALTALATVAFASCVMGQAGPENSAAAESARDAAVSRDAAERATHLFLQMEGRHSYSPLKKTLHPSIPD